MVTGSTGSPGRWIPGSLDRWVTKCYPVPCLIYAHKKITQTPELTHNRSGTPRVLHKRLTQTVCDARTHTQQGRDPEGSAQDTHTNDTRRPNSHTTGPGPRGFRTRDSHKRYVTPELTHNRTGTPRVLHKRLTQTVRDVRTHTQQGRDPKGSAAARLTAGHHRTATRHLLVSPRLPPASVATFRPSVGSGAL